MNKRNINCIIYSRCSTDEDRQDVDKQSKELIQYAKAYGWKYKVVTEYVSGFKNVHRPLFEQMLQDIRKKKYNVLLVYDLSRFSRQPPYIVNQQLERIVHEYGCRVISLNDNIDSDNEITWNVIKNIFTWINNNYSKQLSNSIKAGIQNKKVKGKYNGGRPKIDVNKFDVLKAYSQTNSYRKASKLLKEQGINISYISVQRIVKENKNILN